MMKIFIIILTFVVSTSVFSEGLNKFKIEGYGLGDNLIDFMSEKRIRQFYQPKYSEGTKNNKEIFIEFSNTNFKVYDNLILSVTNDFDFLKYLPKDNKKFEITSIDGLNFIVINRCLRKQKQIEEEFDTGFKYISKEKKVIKHPSDKSGNSVVYYILYTFKNGDRLKLSCYDWSEYITNSNNWKDNLRVSMMTKSHYNWLTQN